MNDNTITKNKSLGIKFIAVLLMIMLHTFAFPDRISNVEYTSIFILNGLPIEYYIGRLGSICVGMFTFLSGYGLYISYSRNINYKGIFKRIYNIYLNYWIVFLIFIPIGIVMNRYSVDMKELLLNFIGLKDTYNGEWWFLRLYIMLLLLYPILIKIINKYNKNSIIILSFLINIGGYGLTKITYIIGINSVIISSIVLVLGGQFLFILGIIVAKYGLFDWLKIKLKFSRLMGIVSLIGIILIMLVTVDVLVIGEVLKLIFIPIFIFILAIVINKNSKLAILGKHSTNMWLTHSFFCYYLFQKFTFASKYSILILAQQVIVTIIISIMINKMITFMKNTSIKNKAEVSG